MITPYLKGTVQCYQLCISFVSLPVLITSFCLKKSDMHHTAASATTIYRILLITLALPPKAQAITSNWNNPTSPQLSPPTSSMKRAILSSIITVTVLPFNVNACDFASHTHSFSIITAKKNIMLVLNAQKKRKIGKNNQKYHKTIKI